MQEKDIDATASIGENEIEIKYKGYDFKIPYKDKETSEEITFITAFVGGKDSSDHKIIYVYLTKSGKPYITDNETNKICINDKYPELSGENNLKIQDIFLYSEKKLWEITIKSKEIQNIFDLNNYEIINILDLETIENGKYKNNNIRNFFEGIILDDGNFYVPTEENTLQEIKIPQLENIKIYNYGKGIIDNQSCLIIIDETGKMYNFETGNELSSTYANGFFSDKKIEYMGMYYKRENKAREIKYKYNFYDFFTTDDGKTYIYDVKNENIECINDKILKNEYITNIYNINNPDPEIYEEYYIIIRTKSGKLYCTEDMKEFKELNENNLPKLTLTGYGL